MANEIHVDDTGTTFIITITDDGDPVNLSLVSSLSIVLKKPDGTLHTKVATLYGTGTDGKISYTSVSGDFDQVGLYKIQAVVTIGLLTYHSSVSDFKVFKNL